MKWGVSPMFPTLIEVLLLTSLSQFSCTNAKISKGTEISGTRQPCNNEGETVIVNHIPNTKKCFTCICKNGFVECQKSCPPTQGCHFLVPTQHSECCLQCRACVHNNTLHASHTEWTDPSDPCRILRCEAGIITEAPLRCYTPCRNPVPPAPGQCCPSCSGCEVNGQIATAEKGVTLIEDQCVKCRCEGSRVRCTKHACAVLQCAPAFQRKLPGECCPKCVGERRLFQVRNSCLLADRVLKQNERVEFDRCTHCTCVNETAICRRQTCPVLECDKLLQKTKPGECCPSCPKVEEVRTGCRFGDQSYQDGDTWQLDACRSCMCHRGEPRCAMQRCVTRTEPCPNGFKSVKLPGQCCSECVENDGVCTIFGDPHYKTFDGKFYSFQGSCKYLLTEDTQNKTFSIRVTNDIRNTHFSSWTRTISLKLPDTRINLGQKMRVKINGKRVSTPYKLSNIVTIERTNESVIVDTKIGVKILWDGGGLLEITVPSSYKGKLTGLCGNFNSIAHDDLTTRKHKILTDLEVNKFGDSWRVGGKKSCGRQNELLFKKPCKLKLSKNPCKFVKDTNHFGECDSKLNPQNYYEACLQDMCECNLTDSCYCDSLAAYAQECIRLGVNLPDWRRSTRCRNGSKVRFKSSSNLNPIVSTGTPFLAVKPVRSRNSTRLPRLPIK